MTGSAKKDALRRCLARLGHWHVRVRLGLNVREPPGDARGKHSHAGVFLRAERFPLDADHQGGGQDFYQATLARFGGATLGLR